MNGLPERDAAPCDPLPPCRNWYAAWDLVGAWRDGRRFTLAVRLHADPDPAEVAAACAEAAVRCGVFFRTVLMTDPLGRVVGRWSATTFRSSEKPGGTPRTLRPALVRGVVDLRRGVPEGSLRDLGESMTDRWAPRPIVAGVPFREGKR